MEFDAFSGLAPLNIHCKYSYPPPRASVPNAHTETKRFPLQDRELLLLEVSLALLRRLSSTFSMTNSASNTASARVSPMPVRVLVASRNTIHFQPYGFVVSTTSNWIVLYSMTTLRVIPPFIQTGVELTP